MPKLFGTDGIRGVAGTELSAELAFKLGCAVAHLIRDNGWDRKIIMGRDSRISGPMLHSSLAAGLNAGGINVDNLSLAPTPVVAFLTRYLKYPLGCVISASHNPIEDNGIKFFNSRGMKVEDEIEEQIEKLLEPDAFELPVLTGTDIGTQESVGNLIHEYVTHILHIGSQDLVGMRIVVDAAYGAASTLAPSIFTLLGCQVFPINCQPDGRKINVQCGATNPKSLKDKIVGVAAELGVALDGDADRAIMLDENGDVVDGDQILAMWAKYLLENNQLPQNSIVGTVLSNKGLEIALAEVGGKLIRADVGDKYVLREMISSGSILGGEQSGHLIFLDHHTTGDGILTTVMVALLIKQTGLPLSKLAAGMSRFPQVQLNIRVRDKDVCLQSKKITDAIRKINDEIARVNGRLLVRPSGTEPLIRVMTEAPDEPTARKHAEMAISLFKEFAVDNNVTEI
ncbi:MAG TPA: phosphoglucosamine mutase [bacterium]